mgnify:FL=1
MQTKLFCHINPLYFANHLLQVVTDTLIDSVLEVLDVVVKDVKAMPSKISNDIKVNLSTSVGEPLNNVVKLGQGKLKPF